LGLTLLEFLAKKGAHIIALVPTPSLTSHHDEILSLLRSTTSNEAIYAEPCQLESPAQIKKFCERFVSSENEKDRRIDALILAHEYSHIGTWSWGIGKVTNLCNEENMNRDEGAMATFLLVTLLLPAMLVAPIERDIRIISIVNPFYAAAAPAFNPRLSSATYSPVSQNRTDFDKPKPDASLTAYKSSWRLEGQRALRTAVFMRHLQRILDALPDPELTLTSPNSSSAIGPTSQNQIKPHKSNILAVTVSPGISRTDTVTPFLLPSISMTPPSTTRQWVGTIL
jgi:NAD(P)-dependent dehydrogenase (short-subunit alcohol dehydrogenase family)